MLRTLSLGALLFGLWILLSGHLEPLLLWLGGASTLAVLWIAHRMDVVDHEGHPIQLGWRALTYFPWLAWEIVTANIEVARLILDPKLPVGPVLLTVRASQKTDLCRAIYANSITLTPGTVTVALVGGRLQVHALTEDLAAGLETGDMDLRVSRVEGT